MNESGRIMKAYESINAGSKPTTGKRSKMFVGNYIIERHDENGNIELVTINVPDEIL